MLIWELSHLLSHSVPLNIHLCALGVLLPGILCLWSISIILYSRIELVVIIRDAGWNRGDVSGDMPTSVGNFEQARSIDLSYSFQFTRLETRG